MLFHKPKVALVCIAKNELDIKEWVLYHRKLGFNDIFIYMNDWKCSLKRSFVHKTSVSGIKKQLKAYNHFLKGNFGYDWAAFFDVDEFLVLKKHYNVQEFLLEYRNNRGLAINWRFFGSCGQRTRKSKNNVLRRFIRTSAHSNKHIKVILNLNHKHVFSGNPHNSNSFVFDTNNKKVSGPFNDGGSIDVAQLNHYCNKSLEEWTAKCGMPRANSGHRFPKKVSQWYKEKSSNQKVRDITARDFYH